MLVLQKIYCLLVRFRFRFVRKGDGCDAGGRHSYLRCNSCVFRFHLCGKKLGCSADWNGEQLRGQNAATCFFLALRFLTQRQNVGKFLSPRIHKFYRWTTPAGGPKAVNFAKSAPDLPNFLGAAGSLQNGLPAPLCQIFQSKIETIRDAFCPFLDATSLPRNFGSRQQPDII